MLPDFRVRQRDFLLEISRAITAQLDPTEVLRRVLNASVVMLSGQVGLIALRNEADGLYYIRAATGVDTEQIPHLNQQIHDLYIDPEQGLESEFLKARLREMMVAIDIELRQFVALPLIFADEPLGLLIVFLAYRSTASANDLQVLQSFADQAAIAVHNAQLYERIDQERRRLAAILEYSADGVMILDPSLRILRFNRALERMTGWQAQDAIGLYQDEVVVWERLEQGDLREALDNGWVWRTSESAPPQTLYVEGDLMRLDGLTISIGIIYAPLFAANGRLSNIIANVRDITNFRRAQEMQNVFISGISHELKTPVAIIKGYAATLRREDATWDAQTIRDNLAVIEDEADRLTVLIQNLLVASKLQAERNISLELTEVPLDQLAARAVERFTMQTTKHRFILSFPPHFPGVQGDPMRLREVLDNLLSNAIKYSPKGGIIEVGGTFDSDRVTLFVRDEGAGISETDQERIFERFFRVDGKLSRRTQGTGLGLYLAKAIVEAHRGKMRVESKPGRGSTFYFTIPL
jgi:PAS domain S-box-containing protein